MKVWIDVTNTPHVNVVMPIVRHLEASGHELLFTARDFSETLPLLSKNGIEPIILGSYGGKNRVSKAVALFRRLAELQQKVPEFDIAFSLGGNYTSMIAWLRGKPSIIFSDNDISFKWFSFKFGKYFLFPKHFNSEAVERKYGLGADRVFKFDGFKENIYLSGYTPDPDFLKILPFRDFIVIRPENLKASYVPTDSTTIVPQLFETFKDRNILFLPRYHEERDYAKGYDNIFIPDGPLNGLDVCHYCTAMLTGAGTFAREAALMGRPAVSFFPGKIFLTVDEEMIGNGWMFKSRDIGAIKKYVDESKTDENRSANNDKVKEEVLQIFDKILAKHA